jgi:hypothetical protein
MKKKENPKMFGKRSYMFGQFAPANDQANPLQLVQICTELKHFQDALICKDSEDILFDVFETFEFQHGLWAQFPQRDP